MLRKRKLFILSSILILLIIVSICCIDAYKQYVSFRFEKVVEGQFYKSGAVPPERLYEYTSQHNIKTIIDLRHGQIQDKLNPASEDNILSEREAALRIDGVRYYNIPSDQIPSEENLQAYFKIINDEDNYPIWVHCADGIGRANLYTALYKIEVLSYEPEEARRETRWPLKFSNFDKGTPKGDYLINYKKKSIAQND